MSKKSLGELILLDPIDVPNKQLLIDASIRLEKDFEVLSGYNSKKHNVEAYKLVALFLKFLAERVKE